MKKEALAADAWIKKLAPSTELRRWFAHHVERWEGFQRRYREELSANPGTREPILGLLARDPMWWFSRFGFMLLMQSALFPAVLLFLALLLAPHFRIREFGPEPPSRAALWPLSASVPSTGVSRSSTGRRRWSRGSRVAHDEPG
jgi:hypothetical protein